MTHPLRLSASAVNDYMECPYRYALNYVRRLPDRQRHAIPTLAFGLILHDILAGFIREGGWQRVSREGIFALLAGRWPAGLYDDPAIARANFDHAAELLGRFYDAPYPRNVARELDVERQHAWSRARRGILAKGRIDRAVLLEDGTVEFVDYKTGRIPRDSESLGREPQALIYRSLAGEAYRQLSPPSIRVTFYYLVSGMPLSIDFDREDFLAGWQRIERVAVGIREGLATYTAGDHLHQAFEPRPGLRCQFCPCRGHCRSLLEDGVVGEEPGRRPASNKNGEVLP